MQTVVDTTDNLTRKKWAKGLFARLQKDFTFPSLVGTTANAPIQIKSDLRKGQGDEITFGIRLPLVGTATIGRDSIEGKAEEQRFRDFKLTIDKTRKSVDAGIDLDRQRVPYDLMAEARDGMQEWWRDFLDEYLFHHLCGNSNMVADFAKLGGQAFGTAPVEPDANHLMTVGGAAEASMSANDEMTLAHLDKAKQRAEVPVAGSNNFKIRPIMIRNRKFYRVILHNYVFDQLRRNTNVAEWGDMLRAAQKFGDPMVELEYNGLLISRSEKVISKEVATDDSSVKIWRNVLVGAQAAVWGWGQAGQTTGTVMSFHVEKMDHGARTEISSGGILGMAKTRFKKGASGEDHGDYGVIVLPSAATELNS